MRSVRCALRLHRWRWKYDHEDAYYREVGICQKCRVVRKRNLVCNPYHDAGRVDS